MDVFISHSSADSKLATRLSRSLEKRGLSVWLDSEKLEADSNWRYEVEKAVHSAKNVLLLIDRYREPDKAQEFTWRASLEAAWQDPKKRLIPVLRRGAKLPKFVLSGSSGGNMVRGVRLDDARNLRGAVDLIVKIANGRPGNASYRVEHPEDDTIRAGSDAWRPGSSHLPIDELDPEPVSTSHTDLPVVDDQAAFCIDPEDDDERSERLAEIERAVAHLE